jgi:hypothetical protein
VIDRRGETRMPNRRWSDLSGRTRRFIILGALFEGVLKILALVDIKRRSASEIRGSKTGWVVAIVVGNSVGAIPISYFLYGRRDTRHGS